MVTKQRGEIIHPTDTVQLRAVFRDQAGVPTDTDLFPTVSIIQASGLVLLAPTRAGVYQLSDGVYGYDLTLGINPNLGNYQDVWSGTIGGGSVGGTFSFLVSTTDLPSLNSDGYYALGDDVGFNYSQTAILNINKILKGLRSRLRSSGKVKRKDAYGNDVYVSCDIYSVDILVTFVVMALSNFNSIPYFTRFTMEDTHIIDHFLEILVQGAALYALASQALIERGREFNISDNGIQFTPPSVSDLLQTQYSALLSSYNEQVKYIKNSMRPNPKALGTLTATSFNPNLARMRTLRARRIY